MDVRKQCLPVDASIRYSFFDTKVQAILESRHAVEKGKPDAYTAWPIFVFHYLDWLGSRHETHRDQGVFVWMFEKDPYFVLDLLRTLTEYHSLPESGWLIDRVLRELSPEMVPEKYNYICRITEMDPKEFSSLDPGFKTKAVYIDSKEMLDIIRKRFPQHARLRVKAITDKHSKLLPEYARLRTHWDKHITAEWNRVRNAPNPGFDYIEDCFRDIEFPPFVNS